MRLLSRLLKLQERRELQRLGWYLFASGVWHVLEVGSLGVRVVEARLRVDHPPQRVAQRTDAVLRLARDSERLHARLAYESRQVLPRGLDVHFVRDDERRALRQLDGVAGDLLLENAKAIVAEYPLPTDLTFQERKLDEYTRNSMIEKILTKIDSTSYKMAEFISTDVKL